jgi:transposase, IS5 family
VQGKPSHIFKNLALEVRQLYRKEKQQSIEDFDLPFEGALATDNRWVVKAEMIPWDKIEGDYSDLFPGGSGNVAKPARVAFGALIIKETLGLTDEETVEQIRENPYLQYFLGFKKYTNKKPFDPSLMVRFRQRFSLEQTAAINETICKKDHEDGDPPATGGRESSDEPPPNKGKLIMDATCVPADIRYPTDLSLLNEAREKTEALIDTLFEPLKGKINKPRTYRRVARKDYLLAAKKRKLHKKELRRALRKQLGYLNRNLKHIKTLESFYKESPLSLAQGLKLETIKELYLQQKQMFTSKTHRVENRIVSISQPHVRPIVRGKARTNVEFGAKLAISVVNGFAFMEKLSWDNCNEGMTFIEAVKRYKLRHGYYPESVHVDKIYRTRDNIRYCKKNSIRISGPRLGRPPKELDPVIKKQAQQDERDRNASEGKFGEGKRRYGLDLIKEKLKETSETAIMVSLIVMNLAHRQRCLFVLFSKSVYRIFKAIIYLPKARILPAAA